MITKQDALKSKLRQQEFWSPFL